ncbi:MAG: phosphate/phosphite/phosphonate ABC transporter substrate-binding protein [Armatimonadetes bacterium]|nr:phosphate/phosphite/phosphonate ABC transporter substrate-binding protein [Armatimonadota bacterium]
MSKAALSWAIIGSLTIATILCWTTGCGRVHPGEPAVRAQPTVKIAFMPRYSLQTMAKRYMPLVKYLRRETDYDIRYISAVGYSGFLSAVEQADAEFAFVNPVAYVTLHKTRGAYPLVMTQEPDFAGGPPRATYRGVILARADSGISNIADLRGKIIASAPQMAVAGYLAPVAVCRRHGLNVSQQATVVACPTQEDVLKRLQGGRADAGFVREGIWREAVGGGPTGTELSPIAYTETYPGWCICAMGDTDPNMAEALKQKLMDLNREDLAHRNVLRDAGLHGFVEASDEQYNAVRRLLAEIGVPY